jgi:hypothetical protein
MKKVLLIAIMVVVGFKLLSIYQTKMAKLDPQYKEPYIVIYGRKTDGNTLHMQTVLHSKGYRYYYVDVDAPGASAGLEKRMSQSGLEIGRYVLPVMEVNARMQANPKPEWVIENYRIDHTGKKI